ncbi:hypothetical protein FH603_4234 [Spirosoma sp. LMG 31447]|uniref:Uncharacterized protein n=1 Tax=Spirosoma utsteinense TaxID=2585773 RepID=A0ABR6WAW2_9BACT|nr:hypothetical protein [Spirosoma utsteinense]
MLTKVPPAIVDRAFVFYRLIYACFVNKLLLDPGA